MTVIVAVVETSTTNFHDVVETRLRASAPSCNSMAIWALPVIIEDLGVAAVRVVVAVAHTKEGLSIT